MWSQPTGGGNEVFDAADPRSPGVFFERRRHHGEETNPPNLLCDPRGQPCAQAPPSLATAGSDPMRWLDRLVAKRLSAWRLTSTAISPQRASLYLGPDGVS